MRSNILVIGGGGREHAIVWKLRQSPRADKVIVAPGNGGTDKIAKNIPIAPTDIENLLKLAKDNAINLTIVGPENPLALGIVDAFREQGLRIFGPTRAAARIETSKVIAKRLMEEHEIPTAPFRVFRKYDPAIRYVREHGAPIVIKASGPALGKGAYPCQTLASAEKALEEIMIKRVHGQAGDEVIIEDFLEGPEISIQALCDGISSTLLHTAQDYKPIFDGDRGKNTGGMGAISPRIPLISCKTLHEIKNIIIARTLKALKELNRPFTGCLYPGLKLTTSGPMVLEFNARFGDPETQVLMRRLKTDLLDLLDACVDGRLAEITPEWHSHVAVCVVLASYGYPGEYETGFPITGIAEAKKIPGVVVFHAGTATRDDGQLVTSGGRVLNITATDDTLKGALERAYKAVECIYFKGMRFRKDIGIKALSALNQ